MVTDEQGEVARATHYPAPIRSSRQDEWVVNLFRYGYGGGSFTIVGPTSRYHFEPILMALVEGAKVLAERRVSPEVLATKQAQGLAGIHSHSSEWDTDG